MTSVKTKAIVK